MKAEGGLCYPSLDICVNYPLSTVTKFSPQRQSNEFGEVPIGSFIKINGCNVLHTIVNKENIIYKKKFTTDSLKHICINEPMDFCFQKGDVIKINYETLEAKFISKIISPGNGYYAGDFATVLDNMMPVIAKSI